MTLQQYLSIFPVFCCPQGISKPHSRPFLDVIFPSLLLSIEYTIGFEKKRNSLPFFHGIWKQDIFTFEIFVTLYGSFAGSEYKHCVRLQGIFAGSDYKYVVRFQGIYAGSEYKYFVRFQGIFADSDYKFLAHLSQRLIGELIVLAGICRPSVIQRQHFQTTSPKRMKPILSIFHI